MSNEDLIRALEDLINALHAPSHMLLVACQKADAVLRAAKEEQQQQQQKSPPSGNS